MRRALEHKWPLLDPDEATYWIGRWARGISPYSRVRMHAIRLQLDAVVALALECGLRRAETRKLDVESMHYDCIGVVVWGPGGPWRGEHREVPYTSRVRGVVTRWLEFRALIRSDEGAAWLNLWAAETLGEPLRTDAFNRLLRNYLGPEWSYKRLRDTCAVGWLDAGLPVEHVRRLLGLATLEATLPYARHARGSLETRMTCAEQRFNAEIAA